MQLSFIVGAILLSCASGFHVPSQYKHSQCRQVRGFRAATVKPFAVIAADTRLFGQKMNPAEKYFQLEELEDAETATTEVFLHTDQTVSVGETDGPLHIQASGTWSRLDNGGLSMTLSRTFRAGTEKEDFTAIGEFEFTVERQFTGEMTMVGGKVAVSGAVVAIDEVLGDKEVGFFNMIDTTDERGDAAAAPPL